MPTTDPGQEIRIATKRGPGIEQQKRQNVETCGKAPLKLLSHTFYKCIFRISNYTSNPSVLTPFSDVCRVCVCVCVTVRVCERLGTSMLQRQTEQDRISLA